MRILVTGSAGFIGYHLSKRLLERGDTVIGIDNLNDYYDVNLKKDRNKILKSFQGYSFFKIDIAEYDKLNKCFVNADAVIHLAAQAGVRYSLKNPLVCGRNNLLGFLNVLHLTKESGSPHFIYASSSSVYGNCKEKPFGEDFKLDTPISLYAATKKSNELLAHAYHHNYGLSCTGFRFFTAYGEYGRPDMAYYSFAKNISEGKPIAVYGKGKLTRDFTYIADIVDGIVAAIDKPRKYEVYNLGRGEPQNLLKFIQCIETAIGKKAKIKFVKTPPSDVQSTFADTSKARRNLSYKPKVSMEEGIERFIDWYKVYHEI